VQKNNDRIMHLLLKHEADCNSKNAADLTFLLHVMIEDYKKMMNLLLLYEIDVQHVDDYHQSALH